MENFVAFYFHLNMKKTVKRESMRILITNILNITRHGRYNL